jgi:hypothetical protein
MRHRPTVGSFGYWLVAMLLCSNRKNVIDSWLGTRRLSGATANWTTSLEKKRGKFRHTFSVSTARSWNASSIHPLSIIINPDPANPCQIA